VKGYRKTAVTALALVLAYALAQQSLLTPDYTTMTIAIIAAFVAANLWGDHKGAS
jgi:hypothetical protein